MIIGGDMMKTVVVYRSKSGFTKTYAEWIAEAVGADIKDSRRVNINDLIAYDTIVYGGALYVGGINGISLIKKGLWRLKGKRVIVFAVGATPIRESIIDEVRDGNFTEKEQKQVQFFMLRGGFDFRKLTTIDKILMLLLKRKLRRTKDKTADERGMLHAYAHPADFTNKKNIEPIVEAILKG